MAWITGIIDTGTNITCISAVAIQRLSLSPSRPSSSQTVGGQVNARLFEVSLTIPPAGNLPGAALTLPNLEVMELAQPTPGVEVLLGMDVLLRCKLFLDGPARQFTLEF